MTVQPKADQPSAETGADLKSDHQLIEKQGRVNQRSRIPRVEKGNKKILTGMSVPLDLPANGRPGVRAGPGHGQKAASTHLNRVMAAFE
jgi:hypothetical protein